MDKLQEQLIKHEGSKKDNSGRHIIYQDTVGKWTCGYGRNLSDVGISETEALFLLQNDISKAKDNVNKYLPWTVNLDRIRYDVLVNMCFNLGIGGLLKFKNTLGLVKQGKYKEAAVAMLDSKWAVQVGRRATDLAKQMETGIYYKNI